MSFIQNYLHEYLQPKDNYLVHYSSVNIDRGPHKKTNFPLPRPSNLFYPPVISYLCNSSKVLLCFLSTIYRIYFVGKKKKPLMLRVQNLLAHNCYSISKEVIDAFRLVRTPNRLYCHTTGLSSGIGHMRLLFFRILPINASAPN